MNNDRSRAFTLIELLVVIAIIAILAAILFPVFAQAKTAAKKTQDLSNMKQIGLGIMMYINDSDDVYPMDQYNASPDPTQWINYNWHSMVSPYIKSGHMYTSGGLQYNDGAKDIFAAPGYPNTTQAPGAYAIRGDVSPDGYAPWQSNYVLRTHSSSEIDKPADKVYIIHRGTSATDLPNTNWNWMQWDGNEWSWTDWLGISNEDQTPTNPNPANYALTNGDCDDLRNGSGLGPTWDNCGMYPRYRYNGTSNMTFFDGHAKGMRRNGKSMQLNYPKNVFIQGISNPDANANGGSLY
jgi:prepilin-type N-terminal cleavage/methylation domain-containing protein/prepilin-type processing-associated H-X9-DG protein